MRNSAINTTLEVTISRDRLEKYLNDSSGDLDRALTLYERNTRLSEAFYTPLQGIEVCLRNTINQHMSCVYGNNWLNGDGVPLHGNTRQAIEAAYEELSAMPGTVPNGSVVAELKFSFWVSLLGNSYDATFWRRALHKGFLRGGGKPRGIVHGRMNAIRRFRNRIAHHEPIFDRNPERMHSEILEAIGWMCLNTKEWVTYHSRFPTIFKSN